MEPELNPLSPRQGHEVPKQKLRPLIGIGACLTGRPVRYNGMDKPANEHVRRICDEFELRPICPETGVGMAVPRPPIHLVGDRRQVQALDVDTHTRNYTKQLDAYAATILQANPQLCGYILVRGSPSCGHANVKRFASDGQLLGRDQQGIFAAALGRINPLLPLADDEELVDTSVRDSFITRVWAYHKRFKAALICRQ